MSAGAQRLRTLEHAYLAGDRHEQQTLLGLLRRRDGEQCHHGCGRAAGRVARVGDRVRAVCRHSRDDRPCGATRLLECAACHTVVRSARAAECCHAPMGAVTADRCVCVADAECRYCTARRFGRARTRGPGRPSLSPEGGPTAPLSVRLPERSLAELRRLVRAGHGPALGDAIRWLIDESAGSRR